MSAPSGAPMALLANFASGYGRVCCADVVVRAVIGWTLVLADETDMVANSLQPRR